MKNVIFTIFSLSAVCLAGCGGSVEPSSSSSSVSSSLSSAASSSLPQIDTLRLQEAAPGFCTTQGIQDNQHNGFSGEGFIDTENALGAFIEWSLNAPSAASVEVTVRFANGSDLGRAGLLSVNGNDGAGNTFDFESTSEWTGWTNETRSIALSAGTNTLRLSAIQNNGLPNIDFIDISGNGLTNAPCPTASSSSVASSSANSSSSFSSSPASVRTPYLEGFGGATTGGAGGNVVYASTGTEINQAMCSRPSADTPLIIMIDGTINHANTTDISGNCDAVDDAIQLKAVSNISLIGVGTRGVLDQIGIHLRNTSNIIIQNLHIKNVKKSGSPTSNGGDAIGMESGVANVWVDHNTLEASGGESDGYDSLLDMKAGVTDVTVSYNLFQNSSRAGLVGSSDSDDKNTNITFHHNWYKNIQQRTPLIRHGLAHSYNNYWSNENQNDMYHGINSRMGAQVLIEGNYFHNANNPILASDDSSEPGCWQTGENTFTPEIYFSRSVGDGALVIGDIVNGQILSTCSVSVPYSYQLDHSSQVPGIVEFNAGIGKM